MEGIVEQVDKRLDSIDRSLESLRSGVEAKIDDLGSSLERKIDRFQSRMTSLIVGTRITTMLTLLAIFFHKQ